MIKCSFCERPLACKSCGKPFQPRHSETHVAVYQPDMAISCPECQKLLVCKWCGFAYGEEEEEEPES
jgi:hypothetical protein